jgi:hypothetical protein
MRPTQLLITTAALVAACAAPASAVAGNQDLRSPDTRDAARAVETPTYQDLRSPDTRDAARAVETPTYQDLRSPDTRDSAQAAEAQSYRDLRPLDPRATQTASQDLRSPDARDAAREVPPVTVATPGVPETTRGFDWGDAGIGAAGMLGLVGILAGSIAAFVAPRRRRRQALAH